MQMVTPYMKDKERRDMDTQVVAHDIIKKILKNYPIINSLDTSEDAHRAIIRLNLGGFKRKDKRGTRYSYPYPIYDD